MRTTGACKRVRKSALGLSSNGDFHDLKCSRTASVRGVAASRAEAVREGCDEPLVLEESSCVLTILRARMALVFLTGVTMDNFRAFGHAEVSFPPAGLVLLAGANNTGKTAFLSALDVIAGDSGDLDSVRHAGADAPPQVKARFSLASSELDLLLSSSPRPEQLLRDKVLTSLEFVFAQDDTFSLFGHRELGLTEVRGDRPAIGPVTVAKLVMRSAGQTGVEFLQTLTSDVAPSTMGVSGHGSPPRWLGEQLPSIPGMEPVSYLIQNWSSRFYHFRALRLGTARAQTLESSERLDPSGNNLSAVLLHLATNRRARFRGVTRFDGRDCSRRRAARGANEPGPAPGNVRQWHGRPEPKRPWHASRAAAYDPGRRVDAAATLHLGRRRAGDEPAPCWPTGTPRPRPRLVQGPPGHRRNAQFGDA